MNSPDPPLLEPDLEDRLRRGLALLAAETPTPRAHHPHWIPAVAAGVVVLTAGAAAVGLTAGPDHGTTLAHQRPTAPVVSQHPAPPATSRTGLTGSLVHYDLASLVTASDRIVVGTVTNVQQYPASSASGRLDYVLAGINLDTVIKGPPGRHLVAFDYVYRNTAGSDPPQGATFTPGSRVLLFLSSSVGTVNAGIRPQHWQVTGGRQGEYTMTGGEPNAPFTLADVMTAAR